MRPNPVRSVIKRADVSVRRKEGDAKVINGSETKVMRPNAM